MKLLLKKDKKKRYFYNIFEISYFYSKFFYFFENYIKDDNKKKTTLKKKYKKSVIYTGKLRLRIKNRCVITNRSKSIYRKFHISRIQFRNLALKGALIGVRKSSW